MCHETPASIAPRIVALLGGETVPWTGNEILGRIASGDFPCELHFDETLRFLLREKKITSESDPWAPNLTSTTRCRLAYMLVPEAKAPSVVRPLPAAEKPKPAPVIVPAPLPPSPALRREPIGPLRDEKARIDREWAGRFGPDCFRNGPAGFVKALFLQARLHGLLPRLRDVLEKSQGRPVDDFERHCENLLQINARDGTIPVGVIDSGVTLDLMAYVSLDLDRAERDGDPSHAREILAFLRTAFDNPTLRSAASPKPAPLPEDLPVRSGSTKVAIPPGDPLLGTSFGPYKITGAIGRGGMGAVYEGLDETLDRRVALKVLHGQFADNREYQDRFLREAKNAANAKLDHPNITQVYAAGRQGAHLWLAMQLIRGRTLNKVLEEKKALPPGEALRIVRQVAEGLAVAHAAGMIHRDIKPDNLMIDDSGRVKIMDFGLMRSIDVKKDGLTQDGLFVGTLEYASPEQCQDKELDARTDLYSLGVVLYQLLSGKRPYHARTAFGYLSMIPDPQQPPLPLRQHDAAIPPVVEALVHKLISKKREDRFSSAEELIRAIDSVARPDQPTAMPPRKAAPSLVAWLIAVAAGVAALFLLWPKAPAPRAPVVPSPVAEAPKKTPVPVRENPPPEVRPAPLAPAPVKPAPPSLPSDPRLALLAGHVPEPAELELLEQLLAVSRATLTSRSGYAFEEAAERLLEFSRVRSFTPWLEIFVHTEVERIQAALRAFQARPLLEGKEEQLLELRDGRSIRGKVVSEASGRLSVESADGGREELPLAQVSPTTFPAARGRKLEALMVRSAAGDASGVLPLLAGLDDVDRRRLAPLLLDQSIEELLRTGDLKALAAFEPPAETVLKARMQALAAEKEAAGLFLRIGEEGSLRSLLTTHLATRAGARAARETLETFDKSIPADEKFELVSAAAWGTWDADTRDAPSGSVVYDKGKNVYVLSAASAKEQVRLIKKLKGAERGYRIRWTFGVGTADAAAFMVAISFTRWFEAGPRSLALFRADKEGAEENVSTVRKAELPARLPGGLIHVIPSAALLLVYLDGRLIFALPDKDYAPGGGLQLGMSGGSVTIESIRVLDRTRD
ncbi:MAG: protein kinase [Planctomycetes bacterium]|nr:protein kinase [Planctomycetota bacterium]